MGVNINTTIRSAQQTNLLDCGLFVIENARMLERRTEGRENVGSNIRARRLDYLTEIVDSATAYRYGNLPPATYLYILAS
jgi:Ulp1 family protease